MLERILHSKRQEVEERKARLSLQELKVRASSVPAPLDFTKAVTRGMGPGARGRGGEVRVIAELKKASPSAGLLREEFHPASLARTYAEAGASALSVLTDGPFFQGSLLHLWEVKEAVSLPVLRKDFIVDAYQLYESRAFHADAVLLITAALQPSELREYVALALDLGLHPLVEVHTVDELALALETEAPLIGINNRDLHSFQTSLDVTFRLLPFLPEERVVVSESGIKNQEEVAKLKEAGVDAILVGEALMKETDPAAKLRQLLGMGR